MSEEMIYQSKNAFLVCREDQMVLVSNGMDYLLSSHPYEPCLYVKIEDQLVAIIHHFLTVDEMEYLAKSQGKMRMITGKEYDISKVCQLILCAIECGIGEADISYLEKKCENVKKEVAEENPLWKELVEDSFYLEYQKYPDCVLDYCILQKETSGHEEKDHKEAVLFAMQQWSKRLKEEYEMEITCAPEKMKSTKVETEDFFKEPLKENENVDESLVKPYWYLFLKPPHENFYSLEDFRKINRLLFPMGTEHLEILEWSTDWSNYFEEGLEWWGARCVSIYDKEKKRFVVIGASATD